MAVCSSDNTTSQNVTDMFHLEDNSSGSPDGRGMYVVNT